MDDDLCAANQLCKAVRVAERSVDHPIDVTSDSRFQGMAMNKGSHAISHLCQMGRHVTADETRWPGYCGKSAGRPLSIACDGFRAVARH
jgi:hypothetical protein